MKKYSTEIKWGVIFVFVALLWMSLEKMMGLHDEHIDKHPMYTMIFIAPAFMIYYMALKDKRDSDLGGKMTWKQAIITGLIISLVVTVLTPLSQYIIHNFISPDYFTNAINHAVENGKSSQEKAEAYFNGASYMWQSVISAPIMGLITAAIVGLIVRKK